MLGVRAKIRVLRSTIYRRPSTRVFGLDRRVREVECAWGDGEEEEEEDEEVSRKETELDAGEMGLKKIKKNKKREQERRSIRGKVLSIPRTMKRVRGDTSESDSN